MMQVLGLILLLATSWYLFKVTSKFLDGQTKKEMTNSINTRKKKLNESKQIFSKEKIRKAWKKYKQAV